MSDNKLENLFSNLLSTFPFSITGYENAEEDFAIIFKKLYENSFLKEQDQFTFLISGFAKLKADKIQNVDFEAWDTITLKKFLFHEFKNKIAPFALSLYVYALKELSPGKSINKLITSNFRSSVILKVQLKNDIEFIAFEHIVRANTLVISVPYKFYEQERFPFNEYENIIKDVSERFLVKENNSNPSEYEIINNQSAHDYGKIFGQLMKMPPDTFKEKLSKMNFANGDLDSLKQCLQNELINPIDLLIIGYVNSLLCYLYDSSIYYFLSVAMVYKNLKYTLGGIGVGTHKEKEIFDETQSFFSIISNHISSNLAVQIVYDNNELLKLEIESYKADLNNKSLGKVLFEFKKVLDSKCPFETCHHHYKHTESLVNYAVQNNWSVDKIWSGITNDIVNVFEPYIALITEFRPLWINIKNAVTAREGKKTEEAFNALLAKLEGTIVIRGLTNREIYLNGNGKKDLEIFFTSDHIEAILNCIYSNALRWGGRSQYADVNVMDFFECEYPHIIFHVGKEPVTDFCGIIDSAKKSKSQHEKLGGMIVLLNEFYHVHLKFVNKNDGTVSTLLYSTGVDNPLQNNNDQSDYSHLQNGFHYQLIFK